MKKLSTLLLFFCFNCIIQSCCGDEYHCFFIDTIIVKHFSVQGRTESIRKDTIKISDYALSLNAGITDDMCLGPLHFGNELYALSCPDPVYQLQDKVEQITIISDANMNDSYPAGSELKGLFKAYGIQANCADTTNNSALCLFEQVEVMQEPIYSLENKLNGRMAISFYEQSLGGSSVNFFNLFLLDTEEAIFDNTHTFEVSFIFSSGKTINLQLPPIHLIN